MLIALLLCMWASTTWAEQVVIETKRVSLVLEVENGKSPQYVYFGAKLNGSELQHLQKPEMFGRMDAYPAYGLNTPAEAALAMSGRLGMEIQPKNMTEDEKALCRKAIAEYKQIRPIVQFGNIYRLFSPYEKKGLASLMYVTDQQDKAVFYWWKTESFQNEHLPRVRMAGLDAKRMYKVKELNRIDLKPMSIEGKSFSGAYLMNHGLDMPLRNEPEWAKKTDWSSRVLLLEAE